MTATIINPGGYFEDMASLNANTIELSDAAITWANQLAQTASRLSTQPDKEWEITLKALAIAGFEQWLGEGAAPLAVTHTALETASTGTTIDLRVGSYRLCIVAMSALSDDHIEIFLDTVENSLTEAIAHLYVIVEVQEEVNQVCILAGLRRDQLLQKIGIKSLQQARLKTEPLAVPISHFDIEPEQILLYLSCLEPIEATVTATVRETVLEATEQTSFVAGVLAEQRAAIAENVINTRVWLENQLDLAVEQLRWSLLPPVATAMRPIKETVDTVLETLANQGVCLPATARGVGGPISIGAYICQIYAWVWSVETAHEPEWTLFLLLGPRVGERLPVGIQLQVSDRTEVIVKEVLAQASSTAYLYTQVQGDQQEQFKVSIILPDGIEITLPVFGFEEVA